MSEFTLNLLKRMIVVEEKNRISWEELFDLVIPKDDPDDFLFKDSLINENYS